MAVSLAQLDQMGSWRRGLLRADLATHGGAAVGLTIAQVVALVGDTRRGQYLHAWLRHRGVTPPEAPRPSRRPRTAAHETQPVVDVPAPRPTHGRREERPRAEVGRGRTHLVVGDCHAAPGQDLRRFSDLGAFVRRLRPDVVVQIGDHYSMDSLCDHEALLTRSAGRLREDIEAGETALALYHAALGNATNAAGGRIEHHFCEGNHDVRVRKLADGAPWLEGIYSVGAAHEAHGWTVHGYRTPARVDGIRYQHDMPAAGGNRAIGGVNHARSLLQRVKYQESVVVGHSHRLDYRTEASHTGKRVHALVCGAYLDHLEGYAGPDNAEWWTGVVVLRDVVDGDPRGGVEFVPRARVA